jgi:poly(3-hydroxybutyrate) depolymerase
VVAEPGEEEIRLALPKDGTIGAWLVAGPIDREIADEGGTLAPRLGDTAGGSGEAPRWRLTLAPNGVVDLASVLGPSLRGRDGGPPGRAAARAYAGGIVRVERGGRHVLLVGADDGLTVFVDGARVYTRDMARMRRDDEDMVAVDLAPGDHAIVLGLQRYGRPWAVKARLLGPDLQPPGGGWRLPGTTAEDARSAASKLAKVSLDRGMTPANYAPVARVRFPAGEPRGMPLSVHARLVGTSGDTLFDAEIGQVHARGGDADLDTPLALPTLAPGDVETDDTSIKIDVDSRTFDFPLHARRAVREATARAQRAIDAAGDGMAPGSLDSVRFLHDRLVGFVGRGDGDIVAQMADAHELEELSAAMEAGRDPYVPTGDDADSGLRGWRTGPMRRAYRSPVDDHLSEFALYVPPNFDPRRAYPLIVALHGMNGFPMEMLMWLFGHDDPDRDGYWEDRHPRHDLDTLDAIVVAPDGHFNTMYRDLGEDDVMRVVDWAEAVYPVDRARVTITGPSMGGIGSAACALHHPDRFAAAEPLCGYQSYFVRGDISGRNLRPWERLIAEERSNVFWAENGANLPLYIVHGTKDLPEENSGVLIDRYEELHYDVEHEHPELGHNVWQMTYEDLKGARWLLTHRRPMHPQSIRFKTLRTRWADDAWLHVRELASSEGWGDVAARIDGRDTITVTTRGVDALGLDRDSSRVDDAAPTEVRIDGDKFVFQAGEAIELHRERSDAGPSPWRAGSAVHDGAFKGGRVTGPIHDVFHEPILFVWGADDASQARANEEVARAWARVRWGVRVDYPVMSDAEFEAHGEPLANERALFLVGNGRSNRLVRELEAAWPLRIEGDAVLVGGARIDAKDGPADRSELGAMFIQPNPRRPDRYVVVVEGVGPLGTWRSLSLPEMLPDYVVYDADVVPARGGLILGSATLRAGGFFTRDWTLPAAPR